MVAIFLRQQKTKIFIHAIIKVSNKNFWFIQNLFCKQQLVVCEEKHTGIGFDAKDYSFTAKFLSASS